MSLASSWSEVDLDRQGRHVGVVRFEHSVHRSAYGTIPVPLAVFNNGAGPTLFAMAGSHGDEYEGQVVLTKLIQGLDITKLRGRLIVMPVANLPAALAATRTSPLDEGNLNRSFSNLGCDTPTYMISQFITEAILPLCDAVYDIHSGGSSLDHLPCSYADLGDDQEIARKTFAALEAMNAPLSWAQPGVPNGPVAGRAVVKQGVMHLSGEFGGGGQLNNTAAWHAARCLYRLMDHLGMYELEDAWREVIQTRFVENTQSHFVYASASGVFEKMAELGETVEKGQLAGYIHAPEEPENPPIPVVFEGSGIVVCVRAMGRTVKGDCLVQLLSEIPRNQIKGWLAA